MKHYAAEVMGTFALVFAGTGAIVINQLSGGAITHPGIALTFGLVVMTMIYAFGEISGAHLNPAVTLAFGLSGRFPAKRIPGYVISQLCGALLASAVLRLLFENTAHLGATLPKGSEMQSLVLEFILTWILMLVVLCVSTGSKEAGTLAGIAVGGVIGFEAMFAGPICGASMNPARSLAPALVSGTFTSLWLYIAGPILGAAAAVPCWTFVRGNGAAGAQAK
ncbi:MAG TPA: MIP family channel protein [Planctomycetota bacterium]|nr:MIP family channel protein [Planctomycetota bacterium]